MLFDVTLKTDGKGYWSEAVKEVRCVQITVPYIDAEEDFGELRVYFNTNDWDIDTDGLIYTDKKFLSLLRSELNAMNLAGDDVDYSEQGMQGEDYVSLDVGGEFLASYKANDPEEYTEVFNRLAIRRKELEMG